MIRSVAIAVRIEALSLLRHGLDEAKTAVSLQPRQQLPGQLDKPVRAACVEKEIAGENAIKAQIVFAAQIE